MTDGITRVIELAERGEGEVVVLAATGRGESDTTRLAAWFTTERQEEWAEFLADCDKFDVEIDKELRIQKLTLAELDWRVNCVLGAQVFSQLYTKRVGRFYGGEADVDDALACDWTLHCLMNGFNARPSAIQ